MWLVNHIRPRLPAGAYKVTFTEPGTGEVLGVTHIKSNGGDMKIACPEYELDIAVKIVGD